MSTVAVIGAGLLGRGIAGVVATAGHKVILHDSNASILADGCRHVTAKRGDSVAVFADPDLEHAAGGADLIIEAVIEDLSIKQEVFRRLDAANSGAILMSNSSVLPISRIAERTVQRDRTVGTHWWNPPDLIPVVEVIRGTATSERVMRDTVEFLNGLGKVPVRVERDVPGFVGNRLQHALWREALAIVSDELCPAQHVDRIVAATLGQTLALRGPLAEIASTGAQRVAQEFEQILPLINSDRHPARLLRARVEQGHLGAKSGEGFLRWEPGDREMAARRLNEHVIARLHGHRCLPRAQVESLLSEFEALIAARLRVALWREAIALVEGGVSEPEIVDQMAMNTIGLRLAVMGPIQNADYVGLDLTLAIHEAVLPSLTADVTVPALLQRPQAPIWGRVFS